MTGHPAIDVIIVAATSAAGRGDHRGQRVLALVLLVALGAALWWFGGALSRPARRIGPLKREHDAPTSAFRAAGGVGRFARPRHHPPGHKPPS